MQHHTPYQPAPGGTDIQTTAQSWLAAKQTLTEQGQEWHSAKLAWEYLVASQNSAEAAKAGDWAMVAEIAREMTRLRQADAQKRRDDMVEAERMEHHLKLTHEAERARWAEEEGLAPDADDEHWLSQHTYEQLKSGDVR